MSALGHKLKMQIKLGIESSRFRPDVAPTDLAKTEARMPFLAVRVPGGIGFQLVYGTDRLSIEHIGW